eukprot:NODE_39_length_35218_cov_0.479655.p6 type:complete len:371 gc:universal NODE_39_length_35218_cov_0.479655:10282-11394(+)
MSNVKAMSLKEEIFIWSKAIECYDNDQLKDALLTFKQLKKTSKVYFNIGIIYRVRGQNEDAIKSFTKATLLDPWFAAAYFMKGVCYCELDRFNEGVTEFNEALQRLRGNSVIDYSQLGLNLVLESADVLLNRAICYYMLKKNTYARDDLRAAQEIAPNDHLAIGIKTDDLQSVPFALAEVVEVFVPPSNKITKDEKVDYLGKSKIIAAVEEGDTFTGFLGRMQRSNSSPNVFGNNMSTISQISSKSIGRSQSNSPQKDNHHIITNVATTPSMKSAPISFSPTTPVTPSTPIPNSKGRIKIKFIYQGKAKMILAPDDVSYDELLKKLRKKCNADIDMYYNKSKSSDLEIISNEHELDIAIDLGEPVVIYCE